MPNDRQNLVDQLNARKKAVAAKLAAQHHEMLDVSSGNRGWLLVAGAGHHRRTQSGQRRTACKVAFPIAFGCVLLSLFLSPFRVRAQATITVNTSAISGTSAQLAFDLINGGSASNTLTISDFSTDGTLGSVFLTGDASGTLPGPVTLMDSPASFFNEYLTDLTLGSTFSFVEDSTTNGPSAGSLPDAFSLFLLDPTTGLPLFSTTDPSASDSLLTLNIDGTPQGDLNVYTAPGGEVIVTGTPGTPVPLPEPATWLLVTAGLVSLLVLRRLRETTLYFG